MKRYALLFGMVLAGFGWICGHDLAQEFPPDKPPVCEPGFKLIRQVEYKEVERRFCKVVPDKRTKWVYSCKPDYFCIPACPIHGHHHQKGCAQCEGCPDCKGPYQRAQLMKMQIEWEYGRKCVVETVKEKVPFIVWRKVPCQPGEPSTVVAPETLPAPRNLTAPSSPQPRPRAPAKKD